MSGFLGSPGADTYAIARIGGVKAVKDGFLLLGVGEDEVLEYLKVPSKVALKWRAEATRVLVAAQRRGFVAKQIDWLAVAATVDLVWAVEQGWVAPVTPVAPDDLDDRADLGEQDEQDEQGELILPEPPKLRAV